MDDVVAAPQERLGFRSQKTMCVGDEAYAEHRSARFTAPGREVHALRLGVRRERPTVSLDDTAIEFRQRPSLEPSTHGLLRVPFGPIGDLHRVDSAQRFNQHAHE